MGTELYRNRNNSTKNNLFGPLQIKSLQERKQNKGGTKEVLIENGHSGLDTCQSFFKSEIHFEGGACVLLETTFCQSVMVRWVCGLKFAFLATINWERR